MFFVQLHVEFVICAWLDFVILVHLVSYAVLSLFPYCSISSLTPSPPYHPLTRPQFHSAGHVERR